MAGYRERARAQLVADIKDAARRQVDEVGAAALSMRAVARDVGVVSSAVYRYFPSRDALLTALIIDGYDELGAAVEAAEAAVARSNLAGRWRAIADTVWGWANEHPQQYGLLYGTPVPGYAAPQDTVGPATRVTVLLSRLLSDAWSVGHDQPEPEPVPRAVHRALAPMREFVAAASDAPLVSDDALVRGVMAWTYLFGAVSFELFGHRRNGLADAPAFFRHETDRIARYAGIPVD